MANEMTIKEKLMHIQHELKAPKNLRNNFGGYNYRNAESILEALKPLLVKFGTTVTITDEVVEIGGRIYVKAVATIYDVNCENTATFDSNGLMITADGKIEATAYAREAETKKGMDDAQITGATSSYARKYALNGLFLLDDTQDVDTEAYQKAERSAQSAPKAQVNKTTPKPKAKPQEAPQAVADPTPVGAPETDQARTELREYLKKHGIDGMIVAQACNLNKNSTHEDFVDALAYAMNLVKSMGGVP